MSFDLTTTELAIAVAAGIVGAGYIAFILVPAVASYGRLWEKAAARGACRCSSSPRCWGSARRWAWRSSGPTTATAALSGAPNLQLRPCRPPDKARSRLRPRRFLGAFEEVSEAVESGAGLPAVARAAGHALDASVAVSDAAGGVLAVACLSPEDERAVLAGEGATETLDLRVADERVGLLRLRPRGAPPRRRAAAHRDHAHRPGGGSRAARPSAPARRRSPASCPTCSRARSPTARTSSPAPRSWAATCRRAPRVVVARARPHGPGGGRLARPCAVGGVARRARRGAHLARRLGGARARAARRRASW